MIVLDLFESMFKQVEVLEHYYNSYLIKVSRDSFSIGYLFGMMEDNKVKYDISEYSVSQTTLEQIFNNFAKEAEKNVSFSISKNNYRILAEEQLLIDLQMEEIPNRRERTEKF